MNDVEAIGGNSLACDKPNSRSISQREMGLRIIKFAMNGAREAIDAIVSIRPSRMSDTGRPLVATYWAFSSPTILGISTEDGHSTRH